MKPNDKQKMTYVWKHILTHFDLSMTKYNNLYEDSGYKWGDKIGVSITKQCLKNYSNNEIVKKGHLFYFLNRLMSQSQYSEYFNKVWIISKEPKGLTIYKKHPIVKDSYLVAETNEIKWLKDNCWLLIKSCGEDSYSLTNAEKQKLKGSVKHYDKWVKEILNKDH